MDNLVVGVGAERKQVSEEVRVNSAGKGWYQGLSVLINCGVVVDWLAQGRKRHC